MRIRSFELDDFRSMQAVRVGSLPDVAVFHGENNSGKSNLLAALRSIFQEKVLEKEEVPGGPEPPAPRPAPFYYGRLTGFRDNFRWSCGAPFKFNVRLEAGSAELNSVIGFDRVMTFLQAAPGHSNWITITGRIDQSGDDGVIQLEQATLNNKVLYKSGADGARDYFPGLDKSLSPDQRQEAADALLLSMTNLVGVIESDRFLTRESADGSQGPSPETFKKWLHRLSLTRESFPIYRNISEAFDSPPFKFGKIGFAKDGQELEIMVLEGDNKRLPIGRLGTGVQQVLMLLARIIQSPAQIVAIEELELNLSYRNQDLVLNKLVDLVHSSDFPMSQLLLTTHSDHLGSRSDVQRYRVVLQDTITHVRRFTAEDRAELFPHSRRRRQPASL